MIHFFEFEKNSRNTDSNNSNKSHIQTKIAKILNLHMLAKGQIRSYSVADILYVTECKHVLMKKSIQKSNSIRCYMLVSKKIIKNVMWIAGGSQCVIFYSKTFQNS